MEKFQYCGEKQSTKRKKKTENLNKGVQPEPAPNVAQMDQHEAVRKLRRKRRRCATPPENKNVDTAVEFWRRKQPAPNLPRPNVPCDLHGIKFIPWGGRSKTTGLVLENTCTIDNMLMCLQAVYNWNQRARNFFDESTIDVAREIRQVLRYIEEDDFYAAKTHWWCQVAKRDFVVDMHGDELDLAKTPLDPIFDNFQETYYCEVHGQYGLARFNPCERLHGNMERQIYHATSTHADVNCILDRECRARKYKVLRPPGDTNHPHFLAFAGTVLPGIRRDRVEDLPVQITIAGENYNLLAVTLNKPPATKKLLGHFVAAFRRGHNDWVCYDGMKTSYTLGIPNYGTVSTTWYATADNA